MFSLPNLSEAHNLIHIDMEQHTHNQPGFIYLDGFTQENVDKWNNAGRHEFLLPDRHPRMGRSRTQSTFPQGVADAKHQSTPVRRTRTSAQL